MEIDEKLQASFRVLELETGATLEEAKRARRQLAKVWHPDRFPEDRVLQEKGRQKLTEIHRAFKAIENFYLGREDPDEQARRKPLPKKFWTRGRAIGASAGFVLGLLFAADVLLRFQEARRSSGAPVVAENLARGVSSGEIVFAEPAQEPPTAVAPVETPAAKLPAPPERKVVVSPPAPPPMVVEPQPAARTSEDEIIKQIWDRAREKARIEAAARAAELEQERLAASKVTEGKRAEGRILRPKAVSQPPPVFPKEMEKRGVPHGWAIVGFTVEVDGRVSSATAVRSSNPEFGRAAVEGVRKWQFEPAARDGRKPALRLEVPIMFSAYASDSDKNGASRMFGRTTTTTPKLRGDMRPIYPPSMRMAGVEGTVTVGFVVKKDGSVVEAKVAKVTVEPALQGARLREAQLEFGAAALSAVTQWRFYPGLNYGEPVDTQMQVPVVFNLEGKRP